MEQNDKKPEVPEERYAKAEIEDNINPWDTDEAPTEWVPTRFEKRIHAIPEDKWNLYQTLGGAVIGLVIAGLLFAGGSGLNAGFLIAVVLALLLPNLLEDRGRRKLQRGRLAMIIAMAIGIGILAVYAGVTTGWNFFTKKEAAEAALRMLSKI